MTILAVDDDLTSQRVLRTILQRSGYRVVTAGNGKDALTQLAGGDVDLVIADLTMPVMDGLELLRTIRSQDSGTALPFIMLTGSAFDEDASAAVSGGADAYLTKPVGSNTLLETVSRVLPDG